MQLNRNAPLAALLIGMVMIQAALPPPASAANSRPVYKPWSVQVDRIEVGDLNTEPSFRVAIYENLLEELAKTSQFKHVLRTGDNGTGSLADVLILKTTVEKYVPGSETRRAVTTFGGATKLQVRIRLFTPNGELVKELLLDGNVRFFGGNLRATHNLARNVAGAIERFSLPELPASPRER